MENDVQLEFAPCEEKWISYCDEFKKVTSLFNILIIRINSKTCELIYCYGEILTKMFGKYKSLQRRKSTWGNWLQDFTRTNNIILSSRQERKYRLFYRTVRRCPRIKNVDGHSEK